MSLLTHNSERLPNNAAASFALGDRLAGRVAMAVGDPPKVGCDKIEHPYFMIEAPVSEDTPPQTDETRQLAAALKRLRIQAGNPSLRAISARIERTDVYRSRSHNTVANLLSMKRLPTRWETVEAVVQALGGD